VFQLLLGLLTVLVLVIPNTISGDGTAHGFIRISLKYNLAIVTFVLTISTIWLGCFAMNSDLEGHQLHLIFTKSIPRWKVWLGKCCGVFLIHAVMLVVASGLIYGFVQWQFINRGFTEVERKKVENEVLVGRRTFYPKIVDVAEIVEDAQQKRLKQLQNQMGDKAGMMASSMARSSRKKVIKNLSRIKFGPKAGREWTISGLPVEEDDVFYLRYRTYVGNLFDSTGKQRRTAGIWAAQLTVEDGVDNNGVPQHKTFYRNATARPQSLIAGVFNEIRMPPIIVDRAGNARFRYVNYDFQQKDQFFQPKDGPMLMVRVTSFMNNYMRAIAVMAMWLAFIASLSCCAATFASLFSSLFLASAYLIVGSLSGFVFSISDTLVALVINSLFVPLEVFDVSDIVADGRLLEWGYIILNFGFSVLFIKALPMALLGMWVYSRREIGLVVKK